MRGASATLEEAFPLVGGAIPQGVHVVMHLKQAAAGWAGVHHRIDGIVARTAAETTETGVVGLERGGRNFG
jgi:hypothetical protein